VGWGAFVRAELGPGVLMILRSARLSIGQGTTLSWRFVAATFQSDKNSMIGILPSYGWLYGLHSVVS